MFLQWMLPENDNEPFAVVVLQFFQDRPQQRTGQTFEVAELFQLNNRRGVAAKMRRLRAGATIGSSGRRSGAVMKEDDTRPQREKDNADDDEKRKRAAHAVSRNIGCGFSHSQFEEEPPISSAGDRVRWATACVAGVRRDSWDMFTGLIEETGSVIALASNGQATQLKIAAQNLAAKSRVGDSVAVNGCCLTVASILENALTFDLLEETLARTNLKNLRPESRVNLEPPLAAGAPLGGHFVQGHVDCAAPILACEQTGADLRIEVELLPEFAGYVASKGSIALNGISLTVAEVSPKSFAVWIIPHTRAQTNLATAGRGDLVNLEFDVLAKYVERMLDHSIVRPK